VAVTSKAPAPLTEPSRRIFLNKLWIGLGFVALVEFLGVAFAFLRSHKSRAREADSADTLTVGQVDEFAPNSATAFIRGRLYLARLEDGGFLALSRKCTHLGCTVPWIEAEMKFACPCHASAFDITGSVINSPAPRPLDLFPILIENNIVKVNTAKPLKRTEFRTEQITYPAQRAR
jgi:cytochrome b6-f complex iron-sulfur subunit